MLFDIKSYAIIIVCGQIVKSCDRSEHKSRHVVLNHVRKDSTLVLSNDDFVQNCVGKLFNRRERKQNQRDAHEAEPIVKHCQFGLVVLFVESVVKLRSASANSAD